MTPLADRRRRRDRAGIALAAGGTGAAVATAGSVEFVRSDFMPLDGWDHVELWVGNAKQAAYFYEHAFGFRRAAYAGPETGVRDRASYVLEQGEIRLVLTSALREDHEIARFALTHGDGVKDIALTCPTRRDAYRQAVQRGARGVAEPHRVEDEHGRVELARSRPTATSSTRSSTAATTRRRTCRATSRRRRRGPASRSGCSRSTTASATSSSAGWTLGRVVRARVGFTEMLHFSDEDIRPSTRR